MKKIILLTKRIVVLILILSFSGCQAINPLGNFEKYNIFRTNSELGKIYYKKGKDIRYVTTINIPPSKVIEGDALIEERTVDQNTDLNTLFSTFDLESVNASTKITRNATVKFSDAKLIEIGILDISEELRKNASLIEDNLTIIDGIEKADFYIVSEALKSSDIDIDISNFIDVEGGLSTKEFSDIANGNTNIDFDRSTSRIVRYSGEKQFYIASKLTKLSISLGFNGNRVFVADNNAKTVSIID